MDRLTTAEFHQPELACELEQMGHKEFSKHLRRDAGLARFAEFPLETQVTARYLLAGRLPKPAHSVPPP
jgi:hypothetical protein